MTGRRLYVYGLVDGQGEASEPLIDDQLNLASDRPINRLETEEMLYRLCGTETGETDCLFNDVATKSPLIYELNFSDYAPAYLASLDTADWLRCYQDEAYSRSLADRVRRYLFPQERRVFPGQSAQLP